MTHSPAILIALEALLVPGTARPKPGLGGSSHRPVFPRRSPVDAQALTPAAEDTQTRSFGPFFSVHRRTR